MIKSFEQLIRKFPLCVFEQRYGGGYCAFLASESEISHVVEQHCAGDVDYEAIAFGLFTTDWYPTVTADTFDKAIERLRIKVTHYLQHERAKDWLLMLDYTENRLFNTEGCFNRNVNHQMPKKFFSFAEFTSDEFYDQITK